METITELIMVYPVSSIIVVGFIVTLISTLVTKWATNQEHLKSLKDRQKELQKELKKCKPGECKFEEIQSEMLQITGVMFKSSFRPVLITIVPFLILFYWLKSIYIPLMGFKWFWWYFGASLASSMLFRKLFKMA